MQLTNDTRRFIRIIHKIPMFEHLKPKQALEILKICTPRALGEKEKVCHYGTRSTEMHILLSGQLMVLSPESTLLTHLSPITIVGEMGLITGQPRSATVLAAQPSSVLEISKTRFDILLKKHPDIGFTIYHNVIHTLADRLDQNNRRLVASQGELEAMRMQVSPRLEIYAA